MTNEKVGLIGESQAQRPAARSTRALRLVWLVAALLVAAHIAFRADAVLFPIRNTVYGPRMSTSALLKAAKCPIQPAPLNVGEDWNPHADPDYAKLAANRLSSAVQHQTESFDDMIPKVPTDPAFDKHYAFADWLVAEYPKLFSGDAGADIKARAQPQSGVSHEVVNTHAHLLTWRGSNPSLQPIVLMAHMDTVPVLAATLGQWTFPPFEGRVTVDATDSTPGTWIWGRGASDCKNSLMGIYGAIERLVDEGFEPERTVMVASGFDEEIGGTKGAAPIAALLQERYGPDSIALLIDEGFTGLTFEHGKTVASLGMAEKGAVNIKITVQTLGGHSSVPPAHTGIGYMSLLLAELEAHPFPAELAPEAPYLKYLTCMAEHAPSFPRKLKRDVKDPKKWPALAKELAASDRVLNSFLATTQAIDLISGGKVNALPEVVETTINYRISFTSSVNETLSHISSLLVPLAAELGFTIDAFGAQTGTNATKSAKHITLVVPGGNIEPAPITPSDAKAFELMAGTARHVFGGETIVTPSGMFANTDTRHFWNLTRNLYRFTPAAISQNLNQHTVDERISLEGHLNTTRFFYKLIQNTAGWEAE